MTNETGGSIQRKILLSIINIVDLKKSLFETCNFPMFIDLYTYSVIIAKKTHNKLHPNNLILSRPVSGPALLLGTCEVHIKTALWDCKTINGSLWDT